MISGRTFPSTVCLCILWKDKKASIFNIKTLKLGMWAQKCIIFLDFSVITAFVKIIKFPHNPSGFRGVRNKDVFFTYRAMFSYMGCHLTVTLILLWHMSNMIHIPLKCFTLFHCINSWWDNMTRILAMHEHSQKRRLLAEVAGMWGLSALEMFYELTIGPWGYTQSYLLGWTVNVNTDFCT